MKDNELEDSSIEQQYAGWEAPKTGVTIHDAYPFDSPLKDSDIYKYKSTRSLNKEFKDFEDPDQQEKLVRVWEVGKKDLDREISDFTKAKPLYDELRIQYGIDYTDFNMFIGPGSSEEISTIYVVTEKVHADNISRGEFDQEQLARMQPSVEAHYVSLMEYAADKLTNGGEFIPDAFFNGQYVYGTKGAGTEEALYLVDVDHYVSSYDPDDPRNTRNEVLILRFPAIVKQMVETEQKFGVKLENARSGIKAILGSIPTTTPYYGHIERAIGLME